MSRLFTEESLGDADRVDSRLDPPLCAQPGPVKPTFKFARWLCNRQPHHDPPHRHYDRHTFDVLAEWE